MINADDLSSQLSPPLDKDLVAALVREYISIEKRYLQADWEPSSLDGGQFCELLGRILYHADSGNLSPKKDLKACLKYFEDDRQPHSITPRHDLLHMAKVTQTIYKFRSQRGAVHISPSYGPNQLDSRYILDASRWLFSEFLRVFWQGDREKVASAIREILRFDLPIVAQYQDRLLVQRTDLTPEEEILILLHHAGENGLSRRELGQHCQRSPSSITTALKNLSSAKSRQIIEVKPRFFQLTDLGSKRIREQLTQKLLTG